MIRCPKWLADGQIFLNRKSMPDYKNVINGIHFEVDGDLRTMKHLKSILLMLKLFQSGVFTVHNNDAVGMYYLETKEPFRLYNFLKETNLSDLKLLKYFRINGRPAITIETLAREKHRLSMAYEFFPIDDEECFMMDEGAISAPYDIFFLLYFSRHVNVGEKKELPISDLLKCVWGFTLEEAIQQYRMFHIKGTLIKAMNRFKKKYNKVWVVDFPKHYLNMRSSLMPNFSITVTRLEGDISQIYVENYMEKPENLITFCDIARALGIKRPTLYYHIQRHKTAMDILKKNSIVRLGRVYFRKGCIDELKSIAQEFTG